MISLDAISTAVNSEVPDFNLWIYRPTDMQATRKSNCLGRAMLSYILARAQGISDEAMSLLVDVDHGAPRQSGEATLGHVALIVDDTEHGVTGVIDSGDYSFVVPQAFFTWRPGLAPEMQDEIATAFPEAIEATETTGPPILPPTR